eukprot:1746784-Rhodomonas_salina.2
MRCTDSAGCGTRRTWAGYSRTRRWPRCSARSPRCGSRQCSTAVGYAAIACYALATGSPVLT